MKENENLNFDVLSAISVLSKKLMRFEKDIHYCDLTDEEWNFLNYDLLSIHDI